MHAHSSTKTLQRERLNQLIPIIRFMARGPYSNERLEILPSGNIKFQLKTPYPNGVTYLLFAPLRDFTNEGHLISPV